MNKKIVKKLLASALAIALCIPMVTMNTMEVNASVSGNVPSASISGNVPGSSASTVVASSNSSNAGESVVTVVNNKVQLSGGKAVKSNVGGVFSATAVKGVAITTPAADIANAVGAADANVRAYVCNNNNKESKAALQNAATAAGKTVAAYVNFDLYSITKKGVVTKISNSAEAVTVVMGLPNAVAKTGAACSVICVTADGSVVVMEDVDTDPRTITINANVFGAYAIVY